MDNPGTWQARDESLPEELPFEAREAIRKATAGPRHSWRVEQARFAAQDMALNMLATEPGKVAAEPLALATAFAATVERHGVGGPFGISGAATDRLPAFSHLGKGRKQATDGAAWDAAIDETAATMPGDVTLETIEGTWCLTRGSEVLAEMNPDAIPARWRQSLAKRAVLIFSGSLREDLRDLFADRLFRSDDVEESLVAWGREYATACRQIEDAEIEARRQERLSRAMYILRMQEYDPDNAATARQQALEREYDPLWPNDFEEAERALAAERAAEMAA